MNGARVAPAFVRICALCALLAFWPRVSAQADLLPSWNDGAAKQATVEFAPTTATQGWIVISMKNDWTRIFAFECSGTDFQSARGSTDNGDVT